MSIFSTYLSVEKIDTRIKDMIETRIFRAYWDVDRRLSEMALSRKQLLATVAVAMHESGNATPFHPANAPGTLAYQHGTWSLRDQFVGDDWVEDRADGVEAIRNDALKIKIAFSNVDLACDDNHVPKPRSRKGAGAERASGASLFGYLPQFAPLPPEGGWALYYLMMDETGAAELTRPVVKNGTFVSAIERIYLSDGQEPDGLVADDEETSSDFDPQIVRK